MLVSAGVLLVQCPDAKGVVAALAQLLFGFNCNILQSDQFSDEALHPSRFFQRIHFDFSDISVGTGNLSVLERAVDELAKRYGMDWKVRAAGISNRSVSDEAVSWEAVGLACTPAQHRF